jgi:tetratricopeptide (TPR) repeat protein
VSDSTLKTNRGPKSTPRAKGEADSEPKRRHHLNLRAVIILAVLLLVGVLGFFLTKAYQAQHQGTALLAEAKQFLEQEPKQPALALTYLNRYLELNPKDIDTLDLKGKVLFDLSRGPKQVMAVVHESRSAEHAMAAIPAHDQVLRGDPQHPRQETRRRLVELNLVAGRQSTAYTLALDLVAAKNHPTAVDYWLLGDVLVVMAGKGATLVTNSEGEEVSPWDEAMKNYEKAQQLDPGNVNGVKMLAFLYTRNDDETKNDPAKARQALDTLLEQTKIDDEKTKTHDQEALAHLVRYDFFARTNDQALALAELDQAVRLKPDNPDILIKAAMDAMLRGDADAGRKYIEAIPPQVRDDLKYAISAELGVIERKLDRAIQDWREGLKATGGTSEALTWRLAYVLLRLGRVSEAEPLIAQYHRLTDRIQPIPKAVYLDAFLLLLKNKAEEAIPKLELIRLNANKANDTAGTEQQGFNESSRLGADVAFTLGQCYELTNREPQALEAYRDAAKIVRNTPGLKWAEPWINAANLLQRANRFDDAAAEISDGLLTIPNDPNLLLTLGRIRLVQQIRLPKERRNFGEIDKILAEARKSSPTSIDLIKLQIPYLASAGRFQEAAAILAEATDPRNNPQNPELWAIQAEVLRRLGDPAKATEALDRGTATVGEHAVLRITRAHVLSTQGRDKDAYETLEEGVGLVPSDERPTILKALGDTHRRLNNLSAARKAYAQWAKLSPQDPQPLLLVLELALAANDEPAIAATVASAKKVGGLAEQLANAFVLLKDPAGGETQEARKKRLDEAGTVIDTIISQNPSRPVGYLLRGQLLERQSRTDEAIQAYRMARDHNAGPEALRSLFRLLARERRFDDLRQLRDQLYANELTPDLEQLAANIALALGEKEQAREMIDHFVKSAPAGLNNQLWQASALNALGEPGQAEEILQNLIEQQPQELNPRLAMLVFQIKHKQPKKAADVVEQIRSQVKTDKPEFIWASCYAMINNMAKASEYYKAALQKWPDDQDVRQRAVAFFQATGHTADAEAMLRELLEREPNHPWGRRELAQVLSARRNDPAAWNEALQLIGDKPADTDTAEDRLVRATVLARSPNRSRLQDAISILNEIVATETPAPASFVAHEVLAQIYSETNQVAEAIKHAQVAAPRSIDPGFIALYAQLLLLDKQPDEAAKQVDRLAQLEPPDGLRVIELRSRVLQAQGKGAEATTLLETAFSNVEKLPDGETASRKIVELLTGLDQLDAAERVSRRMAEIWPKSSWTLAQVLARRDHLDEALKSCQAAVDAGAALEGGTIAAMLVINKPLGADADARIKQANAVINAAIKRLPDNLTLLFSRANMERVQGRYAEAAQLYRDLLAKYPDNAMILNNMAWTLSEDLDQPAEGLERIEAAIQHVGSDASLLDTRGVIFTRLGKFDQAITDLEAAAKANPSAGNLYHLARAYQKAGRTAEFQKYRTRAKEAGLKPTTLQPNERAEMDKLMNE